MELVEVGKERRTEELRRRLREVQAQFLPSRAIYVPVGRRRHRVYRIAVEVCVLACVLVCLCGFVFFWSVLFCSVLFIFSRVYLVCK